jgi:general stress protein 26
LISSGNAIKNHKLSLGIKLNIKPQYYIFYNFKEDISLNNFNDDKILPLNMTDENYTTSIDIYIDDSNITDVQIAIPINFALRKFNLIKNNINKFNLTGLVKKIKSNVLMRCPKSKISNDIYFCTNYDIYKFESGHSIESNVKINLEIVYDGKKQLDITQKSYNELNNDFKENNTNELINDEEFNNIYWMNNSKGDLINRLNKSQENGIVKE